MSPSRRGTAILAAWLLLILSAASLVGCQTLEPVPTPTATRTPILPTPTPTPTSTATPLPTSTPTPTPTATLPPELILPPYATVADVCPPLPADLHFLRGGVLWTCLAEGNAPLELPAAAQARGRTIVDYRVSRDQSRIAYVTDAGELYVFDRASLTHIHLPTSGAVIHQAVTYFDITPNGDAVLYLSWGVQANTGPAIEGDGSGVLLAISVDNPRERQQRVGMCGGTAESPCQGFLLAPDGSRLAVLDMQGLWRIDLNAPNAPRLLAHSDSEHEGARLRGWSPDSQSLVLDMIVGGMPSLVVLSIEASDLQLAPSPLCPTPCVIGTTWAAESGVAELWVTWDTPAQGCYGRIPETTGENVQLAVQPEVATCGAGGIALHPRSPLADSPYLFPSANLAMLQAAGPRMYGGVYAVDRATAPDDAAPAVVALIPDALAGQGGLVWSHDGSAFVHIDDAGEPTVLGVLEAPALWEVRGLLRGATNIKWSETRP